MISSIVTFLASIPAERQYHILGASIGVLAAPLAAAVGADIEQVTSLIDPNTLKAGGLVASTGMLGLLYYLYTLEKKERLERQRKYDEDAKERERLAREDESKKRDDWKADQRQTSEMHKEEIASRIALAEAFAKMNINIDEIKRELEIKSRRGE